MPIQYLKDLRDAVQAAIDAGKTIEQAQEEIMLEQYKDWAFYDRLRAKTVEAAYLNLTQVR